MSKKLIYLIYFVLALSIAVSAQAGLLGHWQLDEGSGTIARDSSGNSHHGSIEGSPTWTSPGWEGWSWCMQFGGDNDRITVESFELTGTGITLAAWIKPTSYKGDARIISKTEGGGTSEHYWCMLLGTSGDTSEDRIQFRLRTDVGSGATAVIAPAGAEIPLNEWTHVAVTWDASDPFIRLFTNADEVHSASKSGTAVALGPGKKIGIGNQSVSAGAGSTSRPFGGFVDDVRVYDYALSTDEMKELLVAVFPAIASNPSPADVATDVPRDVVLSWTQGEYAPRINGHKVYLSENFNDVNDGIGGIIQDANSYARPQRLDFGTTYYWRVDEVNAPPDYTVYEGDVWSFTTEPIAYPIENITATASSAHQADTGPENTINGSGLDVSDLHSIEPADMWLSSDEPNGAWIEYELDKVYKLHEMWVWNHNGMMELMIGVGFKDVSIEYSVNGTDYTTLAGVPEFAQAPGASDYEHNTTVDLGGAAAKYVRLTANSNWGGFVDQYGLSEVLFLYIPVRAREPQPESGATDVDVDLVLSFRAGREAAEHDVYISTDEQAVIDSNVPVSIVTEAQHGPISLDLGETYYWKVNEANMAETPTTWQGDIWNFSTHEFFVVDDFEDYNDYPPDEIWSTWVDGYGIPANGATVGYPAPDWNQGEHYVETAIVHGGSQSMPFFYDNTGTAAYSEGERTFAVPQDWTAAGIQTLAMYFHGTAGNTGQLYVKVNGSKVVYDSDASNLARAEWQPWNIDVASFGASLQSVTTLAIGIDGNGASGTLYFDDFRLYSYGRQFITPVEPNNAGLVGRWKFDEGSGNIAVDSSGNGRDGTISGAEWISPGWDGTGYCLDFDGQGTDRVSLGTFDVSGDAISIACWFNARNLDTPGSDPRIVSKAIGGSSQDHWFMVSSSRVGSEKRLRFRLKTDGDTGEIKAGSAGTIELDVWIHVAATWDGSTMRLYKNGVEVGSIAKGGTLGTNPAANVSIGNQPAGAGDRPFDGLIDEVLICNQALSVAEIAWLAGRTLPFDKPF